MINCIVKWYCKRLKRNIKVDDDATPMLSPIGEGLWVCDCVVKGKDQWTTGDDEFHTPLLKGFRYAKL